MSASLKKRFPYKDGWIHAELTMKSTDLVDRNEVKKFASAGNPEGYEFGAIEQHGRKVVVVSRKKTEAAV